MNSVLMGVWPKFVGRFGQVLEGWHWKSKGLVAIKIVRGLKKYPETTMIEVDVLH